MRRAKSHESAALVLFLSGCLSLVFLLNNLVNHLWILVFIGTSTYLSDSALLSSTYITALWAILFATLTYTGLRLDPSLRRTGKKYLLGTCILALLLILYNVRIL